MTMKKIFKLCVVMLLVVGCQSKNFSNEENWYMVSKTFNDLDDYSVFLDETEFPKEVLEEIKNMEEIEKIEPVFKFPTLLIESHDFETLHGYLKVYKNGEFEEEFTYDETDTTKKKIHLLNIFGYPQTMDIESRSKIVSSDKIENGCYLSSNVASHLGITDLKDRYTLEIYCLIPASASIDIDLLKEHPQLVLNFTEGKHLYYPYILTINVAGILNRDISSSRGQVYIPLDLMHSLIDEYKVEEVDSNNYIVKVKNDQVVQKIKDLDEHLQVLPYPLTQDKNTY